MSVIELICMIMALVLAASAASAMAITLRVSALR